MSITKGIKYSILTAIISGISIFLNKFALSSIQPPLVFTAVKNTAVGLFILSFLLFSHKLPQIKKLTFRQSIYLLLIGLIGGSLPFYLFFTGQADTSALNAALIHKTLVFWVALLAVPFLREKFSLKKIFAILLLFTGNLIIGGFQHFQLSRGELMILAATILWAVENILAKKILPIVDPDIVTAARMGFGSLTLLLASAVFYPQQLANIIHLNSTQIFWLTLTAITLTAYVATWYRALKFAPATTVTAILVASTLVTNLLSAIFITHSLNWPLLLQSGLIISGLYILSKTSLVQKSSFSTS